MKHLILPFIIASTLIFGVILPAEEAVAETANALVGTWSLVWLTNEQGGTRTDLFGPNPKGILMFDDNGHFCFLSTSGVLPKFAVNNRAAGTPEENKAVMQGSMWLWVVVCARDGARIATGGVYHHSCQLVTKIMLLLSQGFRFLVLTPIKRFERSQQPAETNSHE
jgi:hypothetical protein